MKGNSWMKWNIYYGEFQGNLHLKWPVLNFILVPSYLSHLFGSLAFYAASLHTPFVKHKYKIHCPGWIYWPVWSPLDRQVHVWANSFVTAVSGWDLQWSLGIQPAPLPERWGFLQPKCRTQEELQPCWDTSHRWLLGQWSLRRSHWYLSLSLDLPCVTPRQKCKQASE